MAEKEYKDLDTKDVIQKVHDLWRSYSNKRETWATKAQEDKEFRLGVQWTSDQKRVLEARGQSPVVVNRIGSPFPSILNILLYLPRIQSPPILRAAPELTTFIVPVTSNA